MRAIARIVGIVWMLLVGVATVWLGIRETFFGAPGLIFEGGYGEIYLAFVAALPGYFVWKWGKSARAVG